MPQGDKTGPQGQGPMTGRGMGICGDNLGRTSFSRGFGRGFNRGSFGGGFGRGFGRGFGFQAGYAQPRILTDVEEKKILEVQKQDIERRLKRFK